MQLLLLRFTHVQVPIFKATGIQKEIQKENHDFKKENHVHD